jgi:hypothetical protein
LLRQLVQDLQEKMDAIQRQVDVAIAASRLDPETFRRLCDQSGEVGASLRREVEASRPNKVVAMKVRDAD